MNKHSFYAELKQVDNISKEYYNKVIDVDVLKAYLQGKALVSKEDLEYAIRCAFWEIGWEIEDLERWDKVKERLKEALGSE